MSFIDKFKSVFVVPDENKESGKQTVPSQTSEAVMDATSYVKATDMPAGSSDKFNDILTKVLESSNIEGFDYLEYKKAIQAIAKLQNFSEDAQYKTAYAAAAGMNIQPNHLIDTAQRYLNILETELGRFNQTANQFLNSQTTTREQEAIQLKQSISQKEKQLAQIQDELNKHHLRASEIETELNATRQKVNYNINSFKLAYDQLVGQIKDDIRKMEQYLK